MTISPVYHNTRPEGDLLPQEAAAFDLLEQLAGREKVLELIDEDAGEEITFDRYPTGDSYLLNLRRRVNNEIKARLG